MNYSDQIIKLIDEVSKRLQIPFERAMEIAVKQLRYIVIMDWIWIGITILIIICSIYLYHSTVKHEWENSDISFKGFIWICTCVMSVVLIVISVACISQLIQIAVNPDYAIIQLITNMIK